MRTVEQVEKELRKARDEERQATERREKLEQEIKEIYLAAKKALGMDGISAKSWENTTK